MDDLLIRGGHVMDGSGGPGRDLGVVVCAGRIAAVEPRASGSAHRVIDARGHVVAPGFIDIHTHSDFTLPLNPRAESKIRQGVVLEVVGNCGFSATPALPGKSAMLREYLASSAPWLPFQDTTFADYATAFSAKAVNVILQVGHKQWSLSWPLTYSQSTAHWAGVLTTRRFLRNTRVRTRGLLTGPYPRQPMIRPATWSLGSPRGCRVCSGAGAPLCR
jgi:hypothetical protein